MCFLSSYSIQFDFKWGWFLVGTGVLWWTYADLKRQLDSTPESQMLRESVKNESAFLVYSIVATIITVNLFIFNMLS
jgi:hypothetical protein